jgi:CubicO group peptidase (beta-lactamase class C family)
VNPVPIWAPAGALKSTARDLAIFAKAALLRPTAGGHRVPPIVTGGFKIAETPQACQGPDPSLSGCTVTTEGLAWYVQRKNGQGPLTIGKDGGLPGFSAFVGVMPDDQLAIVVLLNSRAIPTPEENSPAKAIGVNILFAIYCLQSQSCRS